MLIFVVCFANNECRINALCKLGFGLYLLVNYLLNKNTAKKNRYTINSAVWEKKMKQVKKQATKKQPAIKGSRTGESVANLSQAIADNMFYVQGKFSGTATKNDEYLAVAYTVRDQLLRRWIDSVETYIKDDVRLVCYFSAEFLLGPHLHNNLINLGLLEPMRKAVASYDVKLEDLFEQEEEPGLGNGGLGRLAACYMDSLSSLQIPAIGYGIRYEFGIFDQEIEDGWQVEITDKWLHLGNPWELHRPECTYEVKYGGRTETWRDDQDRFHV
jgi:starch phosphorylase